jgi:hypothetical protein
MAMECKNCNGSGKEVNMLGDIVKCSDCNGMGVLPRFVYEVVEREYMEQYLDTNPNPRYRMVSASIDSHGNKFHIIFEEKE